MPICEALSTARGQPRGRGRSGKRTRPPTAPENHQRRRSLHESPRSETRTSKRLGPSLERRHCGAQLRDVRRTRLPVHPIFPLSSARSRGSARRPLGPLHQFARRPVVLPRPVSDRLERLPCDGRDVFPEVALLETPAGHTVAAAQPDLTVRAAPCPGAVCAAKRHRAWPTPLGPLLMPAERTQTAGKAGLQLRPGHRAVHALLTPRCSAAPSQSAGILSMVFLSRLGRSVLSPASNVPSRRTCTAFRRRE